MTTRTRIRSGLATMAVLALLAPAATAQAESVEEQARAAIESFSVFSTGVNGLIELLPATVGVAITPLGAAAVLGVMGYYDFMSREPKPVWRWYYSPLFWGTVLVLALIGLTNGTLGQALPFLKKPIDGLGFIMRWANGAVGLAVALPVLAMPLLDFIRGNRSALSQAGDLSLAGLALPADVETLILVGVALALLIFIYATVWLATTALDAIALLIPIPLVDLLPKLLKWGVLGTLLVATLVHPVLGLIYSLVLIYVAVRILGWSFRLSVFGTVTVFDGIRQLWRPPAGAGELRAFAGRKLNAPIRTYGSVSRSAEHQVLFTYRSPPLFRRKEERFPGAPSEYIVGRGLLTPSLLWSEPGEGDRSTLLSFPPRYRGAEQMLQRELGASAVEDVGLQRGFKGAIRWIREEFAPPARQT